MLFEPAGRGPYPAILFNHGRGETVQTEGRIEGIAKLGTLFARRGYIFLALFRRGEGLSERQGEFIGDLLEKERTARGNAAANTLQLRLLETDQLSDTLAALKYLRRLPRVDRHRVGVVGHSFGGQLALLEAEGDSSIKAVVAFAPAAGSWATSVELQKRLLQAVAKSTTPAQFVTAANDYSVEASKVLSTEMQRRGKPNELKIYPQFKTSAKEAHQFVYLGTDIWEGDVFVFLDRYLRPGSQ